MYKKKNIDDKKVVEIKATIEMKGGKEILVTREDGKVVSEQEL